MMDEKRAEYKPYTDEWPRMWIINMIIQERKRQDAKWGIQNHSEFKWMTILGEEFGEACKEAFEENGKNYVKELVEVAAVAFAAIENYKRNELAQVKSETV